MKKQKVLTKEIVGEFLKNADSIDLSDFISIEDDAAQILAQHKGDLRLKGLKSLNDAAAYSLAKHEGTLWLHSVTSLSDPAVEALAQHKGEIWFDWARSLLTNQVAEEFLNDNQSVDLTLFAFMENAAAQALAQHKGELRLNGLKSISDTASHALAQHEGDLGLDGLKSMSDAAAHALAHHKGGLSFYRLKSLSDAAAYSLAKHEGGLWLPSVTSLSDAAVLALAKHEGRVCLGGTAKAALTKVKKTKLKPAIAQAYRTATAAGISLAKVKKLITANNPESFTMAVEMLRTMELNSEATWLSLLTKTRIAQLDELCDNRVTNQLLEIGGTGKTIGKLVIENVYLPRLTSLSDSAAQTLAKHKGEELWLGGLTNLSDASALALAKHKGGLRLYGAAAETLERARKRPSTTKQKRSK